MIDSTPQALDKASLGIGDGIPLQASRGGVEELRADVQRLMDIEAIKQLKHAYFRCIDTANMAELATLLHREVLVHFVGGNYEWRLNGRAAFLASLGAAFTNRAVGCHHGHHPEIQMLSAAEATGIWYLADTFWLLDDRRQTSGAAIYWDRYQKANGRWLIRETRYRRIYETSQQLEDNPALTAHYLGDFGPAAGA